MRTTLQRSRMTTRVVMLTLLLAASACARGSTAAQRPSAASSTQPLAASPEPALSPAREEEPREHLDLGVTTKAATLTIRRGPSSSSGVKMRLKMANPLDQQMVLLVDQTEGAWHRVWLPERPNGSRGWVPDRAVKTVVLHERVEIDLSKYTLEWFEDGRLKDRFKVGVGQSQWPTPVGTFYVWARVPQAGSAGPYGVYALGLSGFSPVLSDWPGGGRAALHGTAAAWNKGRKVSHGCVRIFNPDMERLKHLPMGTPVIITK